MYFPWSAFVCLIALVFATAAIGNWLKRRRRAYSRELLAKIARSL